MRGKSQVNLRNTFILPELSTFSEKELLVLVSRGHQRAFKELFERYKVRFYRVTLKMVQSEEIAKDIVQDVFMSIWANRKSLEGVTNPSSYFFTMVYRKVYQHFRKLALDKRFQQLSQKKDKTENTTEKIVLFRETNGLLSRAISLLPPQQQMVFKLCKQEGLSREDVAKYLDISPNTVKNHLAKALKFVHTYLKGSTALFIFVIDRINPF